jgi:hypothetical protein
VYRSFFEKYDKGDVNVLFVDDANFQHYLAGEEFAAHHADATSGTPVEFIAHDSALYHCIVANQDVLCYTPFCNITVNLYRNPEYGIEEEVAEVSHDQGLPSVFSQRIFIDFDKPARVRLYEVSGRCVYDSKGKAVFIDQPVSAGVYFVRMTTDNTDQTTKCVVVK